MTFGKQHPINYKSNSPMVGLNLLQTRTPAMAKQTNSLHQISTNNN